MNWPNFEVGFVCPFAGILLAYSVANCDNPEIPPPTKDTVKVIKKANKEILRTPGCVSEPFDSINLDFPLAFGTRSKFQYPINLATCRTTKYGFDLKKEGHTYLGKFAHCKVRFSKNRPPKPFPYDNCKSLVSYHPL